MLFVWAVHIKTISLLQFLELVAQVFGSFVSKANESYLLSICEHIETNAMKQCETSVVW